MWALMNQELVPLPFLRLHENISHSKYCSSPITVCMACLLVLALSNMVYVNSDKSFYSLSETGR